MAKAGEGEHQATLIPASDDGAQLTLQKHYLAIDAVNWFVNLESSWFKDRLATGTLTIRIGSGESYNIALGLYELKGGAHFAPVFGRPVLPERAFRGGPVTIQAVISGVSQTTGIGKVLQGVADAALGVVGTMVQTATLAGPSQVLSSAGSALVGGVRELLNTQDEKLRLFDPTTGIEKTVQPSELRGPVTYLLLHRGAKLDPKQLKVVTEGGSEIPAYQGRPLEDGVWLLLRLRRSHEYPVEPAWFGKFSAWIGRVEQLADDLETGVLSVEAARAKLTAGGDEEASLYDSFQDLNTTIRSDALLISSEATSYLGVLRVIRLLALRLISGDGQAAFHQTMEQIRSGSLTDPELRAAVADAAAEAARARGVTPKPKSEVAVMADSRNAAAASLSLDQFPRLRSVLAKP